MMAHSAAAQVAVDPIEVGEISYSMSLGKYVVKAVSSEKQTLEFNSNPEEFIVEQLLPSLEFEADPSESALEWTRNTTSDVEILSFSGSSWLYLELINVEPVSKQFLLAIENVQASSWAVLDPEGIVTLTLASVAKPLLGRTVFDEAFVIPLTLAPNEKTRVVISNYALTPSNVVGLDLWAPESFREARTKSHLVQGAYFGFLLFLSLFCLWLSILQKQIVYLYAAAYQLSIGVLIALMTGLAEIIFFPVRVGLVFPVYVSTFMLTGVFASLFSVKFLDIKNTNRRLYNFWRGYIGFGFVLVPFFFYLGLPDRFLFGRNIMIGLGFIALVVGQFLYLYALYICRGRSKIMVVWFITIVLQYWVIVAFQALNSTGFGAEEEFRYLIQLVTVLEGSVLCVMLSALYRNEQALATVAQEEALLNLRIANDVQRSKAEFISM
ncbi:MAG: 7TM diverse intracellular signaling domain-containing protein, partial [Pseudohongiellaceae bacterium]